MEHHGADPGLVGNGALCLWPGGGAAHFIVDLRDNLLGGIYGSVAGDLMEVRGKCGAGVFAPGLDDRQMGGHGGDGLEGYSGADVMLGGAGFDDILGGTGCDTMTGGSGADRFKFYAAQGGTGDQPLMPGDMGRDVITDFDTRGANHDRLSLGRHRAFGDMHIVRRGGDAVVDGEKTLQLIGFDLLVHIHVTLQGVPMVDVMVDMFT